MRCPYCAARLEEESPECPGCRVNLRRAARLLGPVPRIPDSLHDATSALTHPERKQIARRIEQLEHRFPQCRLQLMFRHFAGEHPLQLHAFWIFNLGGYWTDAENRSENRGILLLVDPIDGESALMPGYGLEPFLAHDELDELLAMAEPHWAEKAWAEGALVLLDGLETLLERAAYRAADAFEFSAREKPAPGV